MKVLNMLLRAIATLTIIFLSVVHVKSQTHLAVDKIDSSMIKNANSVIRKSVLEFEVLDIGTATQKVYYAITVLDKAGKDQAVHYIHYDQNIKTRSISGQIYDSDGNLIKKMKSSEIEDRSAVSGFSVYEDNRVKVLNLSSPKFPYTVIYEYELEKQGLLFYPLWMPQASKDVAVEKAEFKIKTPANNDLRYLLNGSVSEPEILESAGSKQYTWKLNNIPAFEIEQFGPKFEKLVPSVRTAPKNFEMGGYIGNMESWEDLGKWQAKLNSGLDILPPDVVKHIEELVSGTTDDREKIRLVYEYMQETTRYVSIQLGIGGWKPFDANYVVENGYGDCKALSNYTQALLNAIGIKAYYTLIRAGKFESNIERNFPSRQFNHVILSVPMESDTIWLECTSQINPFGYTGYFTGDRDALMITEDGGKIVHTPIFEAHENVQKRNGIVHLNDDGSALIEVETTYEGLQYENVNDQIRRSQEERKKWLYNNLSLPSFVITEIEYEQQGTENPQVFEKLNVVVKKYASGAGKRMIFSPNVFNRINTRLPDLDNRQTPVVTRFPFIDIDSIQIKLPDNVHVEILPEESNFSSQFGEYTSTVTVDENGILFVRKLLWQSGEFPPETYNELAEFLKNISKADAAKIVLLNST